MKIRAILIAVSILAGGTAFAATNDTAASKAGDVVKHPIHHAKMKAHHVRHAARHQMNRHHIARHHITRGDQLARQTNLNGQTREVRMEQALAKFRQHS